MKRKLSMALLALFVMTAIGLVLLFGTTPKFVQRNTNDRSGGGMIVVAGRMEAERVSGPRRKVHEANSRKVRLERHWQDTSGTQRR